MRRLHAGLMLLLLAVGGCGQAADQGTAASQPTTTSVDSTTATDDPTTVVEPTPPAAPTATAPPEGSVLLPKDKVDTGAVPYSVPNVWSVGDGRTISVGVDAPTPCTPLTARVAEQTAELVRIAISPMDLPQGGSPDEPTMCAQVITPRVLTVTLDAPLGDRKVVVTESP